MNEIEFIGEDWSIGEDWKLVIILVLRTRAFDLHA